MVNRKKKLEDEYFNIFKDGRGRPTTKEEADRINEIVKEWKEIVLNEQ